MVDEEDLVNGVRLKPFKWICYEAKIKSGLPIRGGLARLVAFGWMCKSYTVKDWTAFVETYGLPLRLGRYGPSATPEDVEILFRAVANIGTDAAAVLPENMKIDFEHAISGSASEKVFESLARWVDEQTSKAVLGQTMTSDSGSSQAQANVHNEVRIDVAQADARSIVGVLKRDLVKPYIDLHYGVQPHYPKLQILIEEAEDLDMLLRHTRGMAALGLRVKQSEVRARLGYSEPDAQDEILGDGKKPTAAPDPALATAINRATEPSQDPLEDLEAQLGEDWEQVISPVLEPVMAILQTATSYEEAINALSEAFPLMDSRPMIDSLVKAAVKARAVGDAPDG